MPLRRYARAASGPGEDCLATIPAFGQGDATLPGAFRPCRSSRLRRFAPLRASQVPRIWGPGSARAEPAPICVSPATDPGVHAVSAPAAMSAASRSVLVPFGARAARIVSQRAALAGASPVMPYPSKRFPRQQPSRRHRRAIPPRRYRSLRLPTLRLRTAAPTPLAAAGLEALLRCRVRRQGRCCQRSCPDAPMGLFLERAGGRCFRGFWADKPHSTAIVIGARVEPVYTRSLDRDPISMMKRSILALWK